jgi:hypothetical protein
MDLAEGIPSDLTWSEDESAAALPVLPWGGLMHPKGEVDPVLTQALYEACLRHVHEAPFFVLTGSLPNGFPVDFYADFAPGDHLSGNQM